MASQAARSSCRQLDSDETADISGDQKRNVARNLQPQFRPPDTIPIARLRASDLM